MAVSARKKAPQVIAGYQVLELLAATDWANVYKGLDPVSGELVAIKVASESVTQNPVLVKRFAQEFTIIRGLQHPHLVRALRFGSDDAGAPMMALEFVNGQSLGDRIASEKQLPEAEAVGLISQVAGALHYAHQKRIIHRDVKPDNILVTPDGVAKLADLGLAKDCDSEELLTRPSSGLGTPNFMAPEQFNDAKNADRRCDVYSLGATLYMALTGAIPFRCKGLMSLLQKKLDNELAPPGDLVAGISPHVERAILRAVQANPRARQSSCLELLQDLAQAAPERPARPAARPAANKARERRASIRYSSSRKGVCRPLSGTEGKTWEVTVHDISSDGVGLVMGRRFEPRAVLRLEVPGEAGDKRRLLVRVVRVIPLAGRQWLLGCVFASRLDEEEAQSMR